MERLIQYYNKFNEEKRLDSRHGLVEFTVSMHVIHYFHVAAFAEIRHALDDSFHIWLCF